MKKKKIVTISIIAVLIVAIMLASYVLIIMPKMGEGITTEEIAKVEEEKYDAGSVNISNWDTENRVNIVYDTAGVPVPVPKGYVASGVDGEHTVNTGFVIYEGEKPVTGSSTDSSVVEAQKTRNQWVWVPVEDPNEIYGTDSEGKKHGKLYSYNENGRNQLNWTEDENTKIMRITNQYDNNEPAVTATYYYDIDSSLPYYLTEETRSSLLKELEENFEITIASIKKYGGFYIGRYETGGLSGEAKVVRGNNDISNQNWYTLYEKSKELRGRNESTKTSMIWGCQQDAVLEWLVKSGSKSYSEVGKVPASWGNYGKIKPTGDNESWKANNIYDLVGNVLDWGLEFAGGYLNSMRSGRSGSLRGIYTPDGGSEPGQYYTGPDLTNTGSRATLYIAL